MFGFGDYPVITGSGVDPAVLRWVPWVLRHSAAFTERRSLVLAMIEDGLDGDPDPARLQTEDGRMHLGICFSRISQWVTAPVDDDENGLSAETIAALYPRASPPQTDQLTMSWQRAGASGLFARRGFRQAGADDRPEPSSFCGAQHSRWASALLPNPCRSALANGPD